ncbi:MAG: hypothetical protein V4667_11610 [Bacteroidota bacterium]
MNKYIVCLLSLFLVVMVVGCKKINNRKIKVTGILWEYCGEAPAPNVTVNLYACKSSSVNSSFTQKLIGTVTTNKDGLFDFGEIDVDKRINYFYKILHTLSEKDNISRGSGAGSPFHVENTIAIYINDSNKEQIIEDGFYMDTLRFCGFAESARVFFSPPPPYSLNDSVNIDISGKYIGYVGNWQHLDLVKSDGSAIYGRSEAGTYKVKVYKKRNNIVTEYEDVWKIKWNENTTYTVNFN